MMLEDRGFTGQDRERRSRRASSAEAALKRVVDEYVERFAAMSDDYLRERAVDVKDVGLRLLRNLLGVEERRAHARRATSCWWPRSSRCRTSSLIEHEHLNGIVLATGGVTSHASILAKSFEIPTVVGARRAPGRGGARGRRLIVDGNSGVVYVNPPLDVVREYDRLDREYRAFNRELEPLRELPAETTDGRRVILYANIGLLGDLHLRAPPRRRRHRSLPHRVPVPHLSRLSGRGGAGAALRAGRARHGGQAGHHPHARPRRRQVSRAT